MVKGYGSCVSAAYEPGIWGTSFFQKNDRCRLYTVRQIAAAGKFMSHEVQCLRVARGYRQYYEKSS